MSTQGRKKAAASIMSPRAHTKATSAPATQTPQKAFSAAGPPAEAEAMPANEFTGRNKLVLDHFNIVKIIARKLTQRLPQQVEKNDLIQDGVLGLIDAAARYRPDMDARFDTFSERRVRGEMLDALRDMDWAPRSLRKLRRDIEGATAQLRHQLRREPTEQEVAQAMSMTSAQYERALDQIRTLELGAQRQLKTTDKDGTPLLELCLDPEEGPDVQLERIEMKRLVAKAMIELPERERHILALYYEEEMTMAEIAGVIGVCESRVSQLHALALHRLRKELNQLKQARVPAAVSQSIAPIDPDDQTQIPFDADTYRLIGKERFILEEIYLHEKSETEIARSLNISPMTVSLRKNDARRTLKEAGEAAGTPIISPRQIAAALRYLQAPPPSSENVKERQTTDAEKPLPPAKSQIAFDTDACLLKPKERSVLEGLFCKGKTIEEIAEGLNITIKSVKTYRERGRRALRKAGEAAGTCIASPFEIAAALRYLQAHKPSPGESPKDDIAQIAFDIDAYRLTRRRRTILESIYLNGNTIKKTADITGLKIHSIYSPLRDGLNILKQAGINVNDTKQIAGALQYLRSQQPLKPARPDFVIPTNYQHAASILKSAGLSALQLNIVFLKYAQNLQPMQIQNQLDIRSHTVRNALYYGKIKLNASGYATKKAIRSIFDVEAPVPT